jgi:hypothetical protein
MQYPLDSRKEMKLLPPRVKTRLELLIGRKDRMSVHLMKAVERRREVGRKKRSERRANHLWM